MFIDTCKDDITKIKIYDLCKMFIYNECILSSGKESNYYVDLSLLLLDGVGLNGIVRLLHHSIKGMEVDAIGGPSLGADPLIFGLAVYSMSSFDKTLHTFVYRENTKNQGIYKCIKNHSCVVGKNVILLDDVVSTGNSLFNVVKELESYNAKILKVISILDRQMGASARFKELGIEYDYLYDISQFNINKGE